MADIKDVKLSGSLDTLHIKDAEAREWIAGAINLFYPVGSVIINFGVDPGNYLTGTHWERTAVGKAVVGVDSANTLMDTAGETFGQADAIVPAHSHTTVSHSHTVNSHSHTVNNHTHGPGSLSGYYRGRADDNSGSGYGGCIHYGYSGGFNRNSSGGGVILNAGATGGSAPGTSASSPGTSASAPNTNSTGVSAANANYQPSMAFYIWKRVS